VPVIDLDELVSIAAASKGTSLSEAAIRARLWRGEIPHIKVAGCVFLSKETAARLAEQYPLIAQ
jgi:hypothetical protein